MAVAENASRSRKTKQSRLRRHGPVQYQMRFRPEVVQKEETMSSMSRTLHSDELAYLTAHASVWRSAAERCSSARPTALSWDSGAPATITCLVPRATPSISPRTPAGHPGEARRRSPMDCCPLQKV